MDLGIKDIYYWNGLIGGENTYGLCFVFGIPIKFQ